MQFRQITRFIHAARGTALITMLALCVATPVSAQKPKLDVVYVPTPHDAVHRMLEMADVKPDDRLIDLGSGDGRIVVQAARDWGVKDAMGVDIDPQRIAEANENARAAGVQDRVRFVEQDLFTLDFSNATVVTMYLLDSLNLKLRPVILDKLKPGTRVVSHVFSMGDWEPDQTIMVRGLNAFLWIVPTKVKGNWRIDMPDGSGITVSLVQDFQKIDGTYSVDGGNNGLSFAVLRGDEIRFSAAGHHFIGKVDGDVMTGVSGPGTVTGWRAKRI